MSIDGSDISDAFGKAMVNYPDRMILIACGEDDTPDNTYLAELMEMGGNWMILPCDGTTALFTKHQEKLIPALMKMME
jgi:hypothetical protein